MADDTAGRAPLTMAFHYLGCAVESDGHIRVPGNVGALIDSFADLVSKVVIVAYTPPEKPTLEDKVEFTISSGNVELCSLGPKGSFLDMRARRGRVRRVVAGARESWDVVVFKLPNRRASAVHDAVGSLPVIAVVVGHTPSVVRQTRWKPARKAAAMAVAAIAERTHRRIVALASATFVNSDELRRRYSRDARQIQLVPLSNRRRRFQHRVDDRMMGRVVRFMISGRITAEKGIFEALDAFAQIRATDVPGAELHIVGVGPDLPRLLERARELGVADAVIEHGWVAAGEALFALYASMDVFLLPSYAEGLPYAVWEAMAHSVLVVCTPVGGLKHEFTDGIELLFVPVKDVGAIVAAVRRLACEPALRRRLLAAGYERSEPVNLDAVAASIVDVIVPATQR